MQNRLFQRLGEWAMLADAPLRDRLRILGVDDIELPDLLTRARRLFARAIETPGGLRIQTIHSFCAVLLRRFPLEAGVSPQFVEMDDRAAAQLRADCIELVAEHYSDRFDALAQYYTGEDFVSLTREIASQRDGFVPPVPPVHIFGLFDIQVDLTPETILQTVFRAETETVLARMIEEMQVGSANDVKHAALLAQISLPWTLDDLATLESLLLHGDGAKKAGPFTGKTGAYPTKDTRERLMDIQDDLDALIGDVERARQLRLALQAAHRSVALHAFAGTFLKLYNAEKSKRGWLDFDDLVLKARDLLIKPDVAAWVLFRLDGGIDHILVDEAQDTSPTQWQVIEALAEEFTAGDGIRRAGERSLFVVGDQKQSIYSFQGADPAAFQQMRNRFADKLAGVAPLQRLDLLHSFRSSAAVLEVVDATFTSDAEALLGPDVRHLAFHADMPGRVDMWPLVVADPANDDPEWYDPVDQTSPTSATVLLAEGLARQIRGWIDGGETIPNADGSRRPMTEGDILILVRGRQRLFHEIIRACKSAELNIAGADRLRLGDELGVKDLLSFLSFLNLPEDDLALATILRSPLFGWTEAQLFDLAAGRGKQFLWQSLRNREDYQETSLILQDLLQDADFSRPYELLERILLRHDGRRKLLARLGPEAEDGIDELLLQALAYERLDIPSLTGFLAWLEADDIEIKREAESAGDKLRVMTVHGAKGLEAPVVILPDTMKVPRETRSEIWPAHDGTPLWKVTKLDRPPVLAEAGALIADADAAERSRLLYVAMTRAEHWLIVCGHGEPPKSTQTWYSTVEAGLGVCNPALLEEIETPFGSGQRVSARDWNAGSVNQTSPVRIAKPVLPDWVSMSPQTLPATSRILSPSDFDGAKTLPGETGLRDPEAAKARGTQLHRLLEHLPGARREDWPALAAALVGTEWPDLLDHVAKVVDDPETGSVLAKEALVEVSITAPFGPDKIVGTIDRLIVDERSILAIDYKSNAIIPETPQNVPLGLLRQMGAYAHALAHIYPDRSIETALLWTAAPRLMSLPTELVLTALGAPRDLDAPEGRA